MKQPPALEKLFDIALKLPDPLYPLCRFVLSDPRFRHAPGGRTHHHAYRGGLMDHTLEVVELVLGMATDTNRDMLTTAAIWHDYAKIFDYTQEGPIEDLPYRFEVGHVVGSFLWFWKAVESLPKETISLDKSSKQYQLFYSIGHCILSHHGRREWGSPVEPQTLEAHILHSADMTSMQRAKAAQKK